MPSESIKIEKHQPVELTPDFLGESRHEFVARLAYQLWERRGMPLGSPEVDWLAAERALYESLVASGAVFAFANDRHDVGRVVLRSGEGRGGEKGRSSGAPVALKKKH